MLAGLHSFLEDGKGVTASLPLLGSGGYLHSLACRWSAASIFKTCCAASSNLSWTSTLLPPASTYKDSEIIVEPTQIIPPSQGQLMCRLNSTCKLHFPLPGNLTYRFWKLGCGLPWPIIILPLVTKMRSYDCVNYVEFLVFEKNEVVDYLDGPFPSFKTFSDSVSAIVLESRRK